MKAISKKKTESPAKYIAAITDLSRREAVIKLHKLIRATAPRLKPFVLGHFLGYGPYHYRYESGREGDWFFVGIANQKASVSLYICAVDGKKYIPELYKKDLVGVSVGKSCIRFSQPDKIDWVVIKKILQHAVRVIARDKQKAQFG